MPSIEEGPIICEDDDEDANIEFGDSETKILSFPQITITEIKQFGSPERASTFIGMTENFEIKQKVSVLATNTHELFEKGREGLTGLGKKWFNNWNNRK